jgi:hypothetical protein
MNIKKQFKIQYEKDFILFSEHNKNKTKTELILTEMGIPTDNKKLVRNCLIYSYLYILYLVFFIVSQTFVMIYSASPVEGCVMSLIMLLPLLFSILKIEPLYYVPFLFLTKNKILHYLFKEQTVSNELKNIVASSFEDKDIRESMMYYLMNNGYASGTNGRLREYLLNPNLKDTEFKDKIKVLNDNIKEKIEELKNTQQSWEDKQVLDAVCSENINKEGFSKNKRKRL